MQYLGMFLATISTVSLCYATLRPDPKTTIDHVHRRITGSMYKKPPDEERTTDYPEITYPAQRRKRPVSSSRQSPKNQRSDAFYADEHPEIPRVRRASLQPSSPSRTSECIQDVGDQDSISEQITRTDKVKATAHRRSYTAPDHSPSSASRQLHRAKSPTTSRHSHSSNTLLSRLQQLSQNRIFMVCCIIGFVIAISAQIFINHNQTAATLSSWGNTHTKQSTTSDNTPASAHKLVIIPQDTDHPAPPVLAESAYLLDANTGTTLYAYNPFTRLPMLSTTKLMTASWQLNLATSIRKSPLRKQ